ncbi:MAG TPA: septal ring lytic transglycosylase RlpA family protein [Burkholderiales bacterium]|nr:septal ring lytic transglycosylase RlpA family protein [Burkholderiales bacterium]
MRPRPFVAALLAVLLGACGTLPRRAPEPGSATVPAPSRQSAASGAWGGGYYKNDGPGANPPPDFASIPDARPKVEPLDPAANRPYQALGREYVPLTRVQPFHERGLASWYGRRYNGLKTSSGERYDMYAMTAAHPVLPIPSYARVTDLANGRSVVVRINDRGPFWPGRIIDLSYAAAYKLGFIGTGSAMVEVDSIVPGEAQLARAAPPAAPAAPPPARQPLAVARPVAPDATPPAARAAPESSGFYLQLGAFSARANAESFRARVYRELAWLSDAIHVIASDGLFKLHLGPYRTPDQARAIAARIQADLNFKPVFVVR